MKKLILIGLLLASFTINAQEITPMKLDTFQLEGKYRSDKKVPIDYGAFRKATVVKITPTIIIPHNLTQAESYKRFSDYLVRRFKDTEKVTFDGAARIEKVNGETFEGSSYTAWWGKLVITDAEDTTTSISALEKVDLKIYPNPASDQLNIESGSGDISAIEFYDLTGKLVKTEYVNHTHFTTINISELTNGVYLINTVGDASAKLQKLIVRK